MSVASRFTRANWRDQGASHRVIGLTREKDTRTRRYNWSIDEDGTECEVHVDIRKRTRPHRAQRARAGSQERLFNDFAYDHRMTVYGDVSQQLVDLFNVHAGGVGRYLPSGA